MLRKVNKQNKRRVFSEWEMGCNGKTNTESLCKTPCAPIGNRLVRILCFRLEKSQWLLMFHFPLIVSLQRDTTFLLQMYINNENTMLADQNN